MRNGSDHNQDNSQLPRKVREKWSIAKIFHGRECLIHMDFMQFGDVSLFESALYEYWWKILLLHLHLPKLKLKFKIAKMLKRKLPLDLMKNDICFLRKLITKTECTWSIVAKAHMEMSICLKFYTSLYCIEEK